MIDGWRSQRAALRRSRWRRLGASLRRVPLRGRLDLALAVLVAVGVGATVGAAWFGTSTAARLGLFDPPLLTDVADRRILVNLRDTLDEAPLTAAVSHGADQAIYLAQGDGTLHRYAPATGLWSTTQPFVADHGLASPVVSSRMKSG